MEGTDYAKDWMKTTSIVVDDDLVVKATKKPRDQHKSPITKTAAYIFSLEKEKKAFLHFAKHFQEI